MSDGFARLHLALTRSLRELDAASLAATRAMQAQPEHVAECHSFIGRAGLLWSVLRDLERHTGALDDVVITLRQLDSAQRETDESGGREVAWWHFRDDVEDALGLERGALDTGDADESEEVT